MYLRTRAFLKSISLKTWLLTGCAATIVPLVWMLAILVHRPSTHIELMPTTQALSATGWQLEFPGAASDDNLKQFNGYFSPARTAFVPAGTEFVIASQPPGLQGEMSDGAASGTWSKNGGRIDQGVSTPSGTRQQLRAPLQPGLYRLAWKSAADTSNSTTIAPANTVSALSMPPAPGLDLLVLAESESSTKGEKTLLKVGGKTIGHYLDPTKSTVKRVREHASSYTVPRFFATLTPEAAKIRLGPDFELGQLIAYMEERDKDGHKIFTTNRHTDVLPLRVELIDKLVKLRERLRQKGVKITHFAVTSGFRTPDYNKQIGGVPFSRHCYGDAVDIFIDENNDHHMDDLNGDGKVDRKDGEVIANACRELELEGAVVPGGIGVYEWGGDDSVRSHVHIDCRGYISRWGQSGSGRYKKTFRWWPAAEFQENENGE